MVRPKLPLMLMMLLLTGLQARAQDSELDRIFQDQDLQSLIDRALQLNITAKVLPPGESPVWNSASSKLTLPGRSVAVRLVGDKLHIDAIFTPYQEPNGELVLVAQGQVWMAGAKEMRYFTTFKSVPVDVGEKVLFFPLGFTPSVDRGSTFTLQIEVEIYPYRKLLEKQKASAAAPTPPPAQAPAPSPVPAPLPTPPVE